MMQIHSPSHEVVLSHEPVFVPGCNMYDQNGVPNFRGIARADVVVNSLLDGVQIPQLYLTGGETIQGLPSEADQLEQEIFKRVGLSMLNNTCVIKDAKSTDSMTNCEIFDQIAAERPDAVSIVTDWAHMPRVLALARKMVPKKTRLAPVITKYNPTLYQIAREVPALPVTAVALFRVTPGDTKTLQVRHQKYVALKQIAKATIPKRK